MLRYRQTAKWLMTAVFLSVGCIGASNAQPPAAKNLIPNPSFELLDDDGLPYGWLFQDREAGAECVTDDSVAHTLDRSVKLTNPHPKESDVYGTFSCEVSVHPGTQYTLSLYARSESPGHAWFGCGPKWQRRRTIAATGGNWQRFSLTFTTNDGETTLHPRINVDSETDGVWIDSVQLEEGEAATDFAMPLMLEGGDAALRVQEATVNPNLVNNWSFEEWQAGQPVGWHWNQRNTDAEIAMDDTRAHSGDRSLKLTNGTPFGAHVYGHLVHEPQITVEPNTTYTASAWVMVESPGIAWVGGATGWRVRAQFPRSSTGGQWVRVQETFTTLSNETEIPFMVLTENPTEGIWVDDVKLERGDTATPFILEDQDGRPRVDFTIAGRDRWGNVVNPWMPGKYPPGEMIFADDLKATGHTLNAGKKDLTVRVLHDGEFATSRTAKLPDAQCARFEFVNDVSRLQGAKVQIAFDIDGSEIARSLEFRIITPGQIRARLEQLQGRLEKLAQKIDGMQEGARYPRATFTVATNFSRWIVEDLAHGELRRAWAQLESIEKIVDRAMQRGEWPAAPTFVTSPVRIEGPSFTARARYPDGAERRQPTMFIGMGHFNQVRKDVDIMPDYGFNIIQIEFGPRHVLPDEDSYSDDAIDDFLEVCDRAGQAGTQVNLLVSPHYFPSWALEKWPHLKDCSGGFLGYCVHAPQARQVIEKYLRYAIPKIKGHPALHSICLSNEPVSTNLTNCRYVRENWHNWLQDKYGTPAELNDLWGSSYDAFDDVPVPGPAFRPDPLIYDFVRYNQQEFAGFHEFMADIIHEIAPEIPVHAKMMICATVGPSGHGPWSIAPELFAEFCEINGNDAWRSYWAPGREWATSWTSELMGFELQRSARNAPVFNSEDHIITDRSVNWQSPDYIYNVYWQGAIHACNAATTWVWERTYDLNSSFCGSILHRPECVEAAGHCTIDLNRLAPQVTALQQVSPKVAVLYAVAGFVWDGKYAGTMSNAWQSCVLGGHKTGFVYERQLEALAGGTSLPDYLEDVEVIILPALEHLSAQAALGLERFAENGGKLIAIDAAPRRDQYDAEYQREVPVAETIESAGGSEMMRKLSAALADHGVEAPARLVTTDGDPAYGIEYLAAPWRDGWLVNVSNYQHDEPTVHLELNDERVDTAVDLISGAQVEFPAPIPTLKPMLLYVSGE